MSERSSAAGPRWRSVAALAVLLVVAAAVAFVTTRAIRGSSDRSTSASKSSSTPGSAAPSGSPLPTRSALTTGALARSTCATSVAGYAPANGTGDDSAAFGRAMAHAVAADPRCYAHGPAGAQAVVYVPAGTYRLDNLTFPSDVRMEVDAGATLQLPKAIGNGRGESIIDWTSA